MLLTTPLVHAARQRWPRATIDLLGLPGTLGMLAGNPEPDHCIEVPAGRRADQARWLLRTQWRRYDLALITRGSDRAHLYGWVTARQRSGLVPLQPVDPDARWPQRWRAAAGAAVRVGWKRQPLDHAVVERDAAHTLIEKLTLIAPWLGVDAIAPTPAAPGTKPTPRGGFEAAAEKGTMALPVQDAGIASAATGTATWLAAGEASGAAMETPTPTGTGGVRERS